MISEALAMVVVVGWAVVVVVVVRCVWVGGLVGDVVSRRSITKATAATMVAITVFGYLSMVVPVSFWVQRARRGVVIL
jgi:hypothetical protein